MQRRKVHVYDDTSPQFFDLRRKKYWRLDYAIAGTDWLYWDLESSEYIQVPYSYPLSLLYDLLLEKSVRVIYKSKTAGVVNLEQIPK